MSDQKLRVHQWTLGNGAVVGVRAARPGELLFGDKLDLGGERMPAVAGMELLRLAGRVEELEANRPKCHICGRPAACLGQYDTMEAPSWACSECCGHGNEDGWCWDFEEIPEKVGALGRECFEQRELAEGHIDFIADFHPQAVATGAENERLRARLEAAEALLRRLGDTLEEEVNGQGGMARAELDLFDLRAFLEADAEPAAAVSP